ncbi:MAG: diacylglycerol kinase [Thermomicrobiales bacterium]|nr:diacylglycerol kinase [Thermomicrobiales bacterium]
MNPSTVAVILNPASGAGKTLKLVPQVTRALQQVGRPFNLHLTTRAGEAPEVARQFALDGASVVIAIGGDGTINEVANGLLASGCAVPLGLVASGHGSDFVRTVKIAKSVDEAIGRACNGQVRRIDVGRATFDDGTSRYFLNVAGLGFDAAVAQRVQKTRLPGSTLPYLMALGGTLARYQNIRVSVEADGELLANRAVFVTVANARYFGGGLMITPMAEIDDGLLDLAVIGDMGKLELLKEVPGVYRGKHVDHPKFLHRRAKSIRIETVEPARVQVDGELAGSAPVTFSVVPGALHLIGCTN